jgi:hypothetical protein
MRCRRHPRHKLSWLTIRETLLDRGTQLVVTLVEVALQIVREVFVGFARWAGRLVNCRKL